MALTESKPQPSRPIKYARNTQVQLRRHPNGEEGQPVLLEKPKCKNCKTEFKNLFNLHAHEQICNIIPLMQCEYCPKTFEKMGSLRMHVKNHHQSILPYRSVLPNGRQVRLVQQQRNLSIPCNFCEHRFVSLADKENHIKTRHPFAL